MDSITKAMFSDHAKAIDLLTARIEQLEDRELNRSISCPHGLKTLKKKRKSE